MDKQVQQGQNNGFQKANKAATLPDPPPFWRDFTPEKLARFDEISKEQAGPSGDGDASRGPGVSRISNLPNDLINLQPPAEPANGVWRVFGERYTLADELPSLTEQGIPSLTGNNNNNGDNENASAGDNNNNHGDRPLQLKRLAKSLLLNFLELAGVMGVNPTQAGDKIDDLRVLFIHMHHAINEFRPHQARESLIAEIQGQLDRLRAETAATRAVTEKARRTLDGLGSLKVPAEDLVGAAPAGTSGAAPDGHDAQVAYWEREKGLWHSVDGEFV